MRSTWHRRLVYLLLALLPLQATAALTICQYSKAAISAPAAMSDMENCPFHQAGEADDPQQSGCASVSACALCGIAVSRPHLVGDASPAPQSGAFRSSPYTSFIADGLLRPPSVPA